jgi:tRNA-binding EMAP/Myf-like protein
MRNTLLALIAIPFIAFAQPKVEVIGGNEINFGSIERSKGPLKKVIQIKNTGNETLKIFSVKPSCGCTTAPLDKDELQPNETANIDITLQINKDEGKITKPITITTNDPKKDKFDVVLVAKVIAELSIFPKSMSFGNMKLGDESTGVIVVTNNSKEPIKITKIINNKPHLKLNISENTVLLPGVDFKVEGKVIPNDDDLMGFNGMITVETDSKLAPSFVLKYSGVVYKLN